jgi:Fe-S cluster assembly ATPase SufC
MPGLYLKEFMSSISVQNLHASINGQEIIRGLDIAFSQGEVHAVMGPNGSGKSTLAKVMAILEPAFAVLDETDSGLDIDALKIVANGVNKLRGPKLGVMLITHYQRLLNYIVPDFVHVMHAGKIVLSGGKELALELESKGYDWLKEEEGAPSTSQAALAK